MRVAERAGRPHGLLPLLCDSALSMAQVSAGATRLSSACNHTVTCTTTHTAQLPATPLHPRPLRSCLLPLNPTPHRSRGPNHRKPSASFTPHPFHSITRVSPSNTN